MIYIFGKVFFYDDIIVDRFLDLKFMLFIIDISWLWFEMYKEVFNILGVMYWGKEFEELYSFLVFFCNKVDLRIG